MTNRVDSSLSNSAGGEAKEGHDLELHDEREEVVDGMEVVGVRGGVGKVRGQDMMKRSVRNEGTQMTGGSPI